MDLGKELSAVGREMLAPVRDIGDYIRAQRTAAQISLRALADKAGVSNPYLSQIERGLRRPSAAILAQIADGLSISAESLLVKAGILRAADVPEAREVTDAIRADWPGSLDGWRAYLCGSPPMVEAVTQLVRGRGLAPEQTHADAFYLQGT